LLKVTYILIAQINTLFKILVLIPWIAQLLLDDDPQKERAEKADNKEEHKGKVLLEQDNRYKEATKKCNASDKDA
jgi:hypothetical protein